MNLLSLGMFVFAIDKLLHDELQVRSDWKHAGNPRIGARDALQFLGPGTETVSLNGSAMAELCDGRVSLDELRDMAGTGESHALVDATGRIYGNFVITAIDERHKHILPDGTPRRIDFGIDLLRAADEPPNA
jgi:hypothetical protein